MSNKFIFKRTVSFFTLFNQGTQSNKDDSFVESRSLFLRKGLHYEIFNGQNLRILSYSFPFLITVLFFFTLYVVSQ